MSFYCESDNALNGRCAKPCAECWEVERVRHRVQMFECWWVMRAQLGTEDKDLAREAWLAGQKAMGDELYRQMIDSAVLACRTNTSDAG